MKVVNFLKSYKWQIVLIVGLAGLLLIVHLVRQKGESDAAQVAGQNFALRIELETLTSFYYVAGTSTQMNAELARTTAEQNLEAVISQNSSKAADFGRYVNMSDDQIKTAAHDQLVSGTGIFATMTNEEQVRMRGDPQAFVQESADISKLMANAAGSLMDMYDNRVDRLTENFDMSANEVFDLARENKVNLFAYPRNFIEIMVELGLNWTESDRQAPGVNLDSDYLEELSRDSSGYFDALVDSLGSFFNACNQC
jgi:hypothetical protein